MKKLIITILLLSLTGCSTQSYGIADHLKLKTTKDNILYSYDTKENGKDVKRYLYKGDKITSNRIERNGKTYKEVPEKRTSNSFTFIEDNNLVGGANDEVNYKSIVYTADELYEENGSWYVVDQATTTIDAFNQQAKGIKNILIRDVFASSIASSSTGDGFLRKNNSTDWATTRGAADANEIKKTDAYGYLGCYIESSKYLILWGTLMFDTGIVIPSTATINSASLNVKVYTDIGNSLDYTVIQSTQATWNSPTTADFDQRGGLSGVSEGASRVGAFTANTYKSWALNSTGLGWIAKNGETKPATASASGKTQLGLRDGYHDIDNNAPTSTAAYLQIFMTEQTGTSSDPYLEIDWTDGATPSGTPNNDIIIFE